MKFKTLATLLLSTAMLAGCDHPNKPDVTIIPGVILTVKVNHIGDTLIGEFLPATSTQSIFEQVQASVSAELIKGKCPVGFPLTWDAKSKRHYASVGVISCDGIERIEAPVTLVESSTRMNGLPGLALGDEILVLFTNQTHVK
ncbi:TPA: hypothetical protein NHR53_006290 [Pseudomonas aeruginosa]|nr:hypothetical protein [Pseudomonas aeruginosa]HCE8129688.1 hypothetical protein [Pseudomonas aeruginosa]HCF0447837.1 hypothetical protein [Pseudomonas aeruginosa]